MKTHYNPYPNDCCPQQAICGTLTGESYEDSNHWGDVDCQRCIKKKDAIMKWVEDTERIIVKQMGDRNDFDRRRDD